MAVRLLAALSGSKARTAVKHTHAAAGTLQIYQSPLHTSSVNSIAWAPYELGLILAAGSSDGSISVHTYQPDGSWHADKVSTGCAWGFAGLSRRGGVGERDGDVGEAAETACWQPARREAGRSQQCDVLRR